jgi:hypothetical protein
MQNFTNRELEILYDNLSEKGVIQHKEVMKELTEISNHVQKTNGRVKKLEIWRAGIAGGMAVILCVGGYFILTIKENLKNEVSKQVIADIEDKYEVEIKD